METTFKNIIDNIRKNNKNENFNKLAKYLFTRSEDIEILNWCNSCLNNGGYCSDHNKEEYCCLDTGNTYECSIAQKIKHKKLERNFCNKWIE